MFANKRPIVVAYDISRNKTRAKVLKVLKEWRLDGQKSVHECWLTQREAEELFLQLSQAIDVETDNLLMAWIETRRGMLARGLGKFTVLYNKVWHAR
jgi:CRISPR-associated protein Cas2